MTKKEFTFGKIWYIITEKESGESTMLDEQNVVPLYKQLIGELEGKIAQGIYQPGEQLMPESDMAKSFGVSLITVRKALKELVDKGLIERQQGKGTFVAKKKVSQESLSGDELFGAVPDFQCEAGGKNVGERSDHGG